MELGELREELQQVQFALGVMSDMLICMPEWQAQLDQYKCEDEVQRAFVAFMAKSERCPEWFEEAKCIITHLLMKTTRPWAEVLGERIAMEQEYKASTERKIQALVSGGDPDDPSLGPSKGARETFSKHLKEYWVLTLQALNDITKHLPEFNGEHKAEDEYAPALLAFMLQKDEQLKLRPLAWRWEVLCVASKWAGQFDERKLTVEGWLAEP